MSNGKILIIEDTQAVAQVIHEILEKNKFSVVDTVISGKSAIDAVRWLKPNLVFMDIDLAGSLGGIPDAENISDKMDIPVIYCTVQPDDITIIWHDLLNHLLVLRGYLNLSKKRQNDAIFLESLGKEDQTAKALQCQNKFPCNYQDIRAQAPIWHDLADIIDSVIVQLKPPSIEINVAVNNVEIFADPRIEKVFYDLMENSLRHGSHVTLMDFSEREMEDELIITYCDNGWGITAKDKNNLFQKGCGKPTDLGLFLSKKILSITGITITENSEPGNSARFKMTVPKGMWRSTKRNM